MTWLLLQTKLFHISISSAVYHRFTRIIYSTLVDLQPQSILWRPVAMSTFTSRSQRMTFLLRRRKQWKLDQSVMISVNENEWIALWLHQQLYCNEGRLFNFYCAIDLCLLHLCHDEWEGGPRGESASGNDRGLINKLPKTLKGGTHCDHSIYSWWMTSIIDRDTSIL